MTFTLYLRLSFFYNYNDVKASSEIFTEKRHADMLLTKEIDAELKREILNWISTVSRVPINTAISFEAVLRDGVVLCKYV